MTSSNYIKNVAIVGAGGNSGKFMTEALLKTGKHVVTALTRQDSQSTLPDGVIVKHIDYSQAETIVAALKGQDVLVITLDGRVTSDVQLQLMRAAAEANVQWILPNEWSPDTANEDIRKDVFIFPPKMAALRAIEELGKSSYIAVSTGFWYEWSLSMAPAFGIDILNRTATLFDEGETKISVSTWPQVGRAVAALLSLPIKSEDDSSQACLEKYKNQFVYINSFTISQKDMLESVCRVTGTGLGDWSISKESARERHLTGKKEFEAYLAGGGDVPRLGLAKLLYARIFFDDGCGDTEHSKGTINDVLGLPREDVDEATAAALERANSTSWS